MAEIPQIYFLNETESVLDAGFQLIKAGKMPIWGSVIADSQSSGRGQRRKFWHSPPGNLYAALRLPAAYPFNTSAGPVAVSAICGRQLRLYGYEILIKWPNDIILVKNGHYGKVGGILLEDHGENVLAGIGINLLASPDEVYISETGALPAANLAAYGKIVPAITELWCGMVKELRQTFSEGGDIWEKYINTFLLWKGKKVEITDGAEQISGIFLKIDSRGCALVEAGATPITCCTGSMRIINS